MIAKYPILDNYANVWPLDVILIHLLKYWSSQGKDKNIAAGVALIQGRR
jgi:hypothetical protein